MKKISICICTRKRQERLRKLLKSIENLETPPNASIRIIVVENDSKDLSESIVNDFSAVSKFRTNYYLETRQGLSFARNRSVKEAKGSDLYCFVDDDQIVAPDWLNELVKCQREFDADGVCGPNPPIFNNKVPSYIKLFHTPKTYEYGTIVKSASTHCLLLKNNYLDMIPGPFDLRLNFTGGEDSYLTHLITNMGGKIRFNPNAIAYEIIPDTRTTIKYVLKMNYQVSNIGLYVKSLQNNRFLKRKTLPRLILRFGFGLLTFLPYLLFGKADKLRGLIRIANALGGFAFFIDKRMQFYK